MPLPLVWPRPVLAGGSVDEGSSLQRLSLPPPSRTSSDAVHRERPQLRRPRPVAHEAPCCSCERHRRDLGLLQTSPAARRLPRPTLGFPHLRPKSSRRRAAAPCA